MCIYLDSKVAGVVRLTHVILYTANILRMNQLLPTTRWRIILRRFNGDKDVSNQPGLHFIAVITLEV